MPITPEQIARRIDDAAKRSMALQAMIDAAEHYTRCDMAHARTDRTDDYLEYLIAEHALTKAIEVVTRWDLCEQRDLIEDEARSECSYDLKEGCYLDHNGEPISPPAGFGSRHPDDRGLGGRI